MKKTACVVVAIVAVALACAEMFPYGRWIDGYPTIRQGMLYTQVVKIMGPPTRSYRSGNELMLSWVCANPGSGFSFTVLFVNYRVVKMSSQTW